MTVSGVSSTNPVAQVYQTQQQQKPAAPKAQPNNATPQDTVHLSSTAKAASGDVDHDGDSH